MKKRRVVLSRSGVTSSVVYHSVNSAKKEDKSNKVSRFSEVPDDEHYPTEKLLFDEISKECNRAMESESKISKRVDNCQTIYNVTWGAKSNINNFVVAGIYCLLGERLSTDDGLPIDNAGSGHKISARLNVIDSSTTNKRCLTQILELSNNAGGDSNIYIRTGISASESSSSSLVWSSWQKLQGIVNIPATLSYDTFIDNGMYSGVHLPMGDMFLLIVLNNYAVVSKMGKTRSIAQIKILLSVSGGITLQKRVGQGDTDITWGNWSNI